MKKQIATLMGSAVVLATSPAFGMEGDMEEKKNTYVLAVGQKGSTRLDLQNGILKEYTDKHLEKAGLSKGQTAWDIGCGNGTMTLELAKKVGEMGRVYAIDRSEEQLAIAKAKVKAEGLENVTFLQGDIRDQTDLPTGIADIVYMRFVLMHIKDPETVIGIVKNLLKDGGVVASQESIMSTFYDSPSHEIFHQYRNTVKTMTKKLGIDVDIGKRLKSLYEEAGYEKTEDYFIQPTLKLSVAQEWFLLDISEWTPGAIDAGAVTAGEVENWRYTINHWPNSNDLFTIQKSAYVLAWKGKRQ